ELDQIPDGYVLSGTLTAGNGGGAVSFTATSGSNKVDISTWDLNSISLTPPANVNGSINLVLLATSTDGSDTLGVKKINLSVTITPVGEGVDQIASTLIASEDTPYTVQLSDLQFNAVAGQEALTEVEIISLPSAGVGALMWYDGSDWQNVTLGQKISATDITAGYLSFLPVAAVVGTSLASFDFKLSDGIYSADAAATLTITIDSADTDGDGIINSIDIDDDNDGILDINEVGDQDGDLLINRLDLDSDNDGIADNVEAQSTAGYIAPLGIDADGDGLDDAYDANVGDTSAAASIGLIPVNSDATDNPDFLDTDSDNDSDIDRLEAGVIAVAATYADVNGSLDTGAAGLDDSNGGAEVDYRDASVTPLILDLDGDGVELLTLAEGVNFDIDADGVIDRTAWVGSDDAFLVWDKNGNGQIDDASELFGEHSIKSDGTKAVDGFDALRDLDSNSDNRLDAEDSHYQDLQLWQDANSDGRVQLGELFSLEEAGVNFIDLVAQVIDEKNQDSWAGLRSSWTNTEGVSQDMDDIWLNYQSSIASSSAPFSEQILQHKTTDVDDLLVDVGLSVPSSALLMTPVAVNATEDLVQLSLDLTQSINRDLLELCYSES
ncbi:MAG: hypothetical protein HRU05_16775, partial [Oceanospirillaceae bacterium]|nr:hypothetical protein [Oceanospirillaceae bacterium]